jgi:hypothetical protein
MITLTSESFWGIFDLTTNSYKLACIDIACPDQLIATDSNGDRYQIKTGEHAMQMHLVGLSDVHLPTQKL